MKIALTGEFRRGKDTVAGIIKRALDDGRETVLLAFADALKAEVSDMTFGYLQPKHLFTRKIYTETYIPKPGAQREWDMHMRRLRKVNGLAWQWWGEFRRQTEGEDYWIKHPTFLTACDLASRNGDHIIITDMRHHNEAAWCRRNGFYTVRIEGPLRAEESRDPLHESEVHVKDLVVHAVLQNYGTMNDLTRDVHRLLKEEIVPYFA